MPIQRFFGHVSLKGQEKIGFFVPFTYMRRGRIPPTAKAALV